MGSVWDTDIDMASQLALQIAGADKLVQFFQRIQHSDNAATQAAGNELKNALKHNPALIGKLNEALQNDAVMRSAIDAYAHHPGDLQRAIQQVTQHPDNTAAILASIDHPQTSTPNTQVATNNGAVQRQPPAKPPQTQQ